MLGTIVIDQILVECIIGVYEFERNNKQPLLIDIELSYDSIKACQSDNLKYAIDYFQITEDVYSFVSQSSFQLIEALTSSIADRVLMNEMIVNTTVSVSKPDALKRANTVSFRLTKNNSLSF